jgi:hypothetical protein
LPPGKRRTDFTALPNVLGRVAGRRFLPPGWKPRLYGRQDACRYSGGRAPGWPSAKTRSKAVWGGRTGQLAFEFLSREGHEGGEVRRTGIVVETASQVNQAPSGATSSGPWTEYAAPTGLKIILAWGSTNMPRLTALGMVWETVFGATPKTAAGTVALPGNDPMGGRVPGWPSAMTRPMAVWGGRTGQWAFECRCTNGKL